MPKKDIQPPHVDSFNDLIVLASIRPGTDIFDKMIGLRFTTKIETRKESK